MKKEIIFIDEDTLTKEELEKLGEEDPEQDEQTAE